MKSSKNIAPLWLLYITVLCSFAFSGYAQVSTGQGEGISPKLKEIVTAESKKGWHRFVEGITVDPADPEKFFSLREMKREPLLRPVMAKGKILEALPSLKEISNYRQRRLDNLPQEHKRFENPHIYKVGISAKLRDKRNELKNQHKTP